VPLGALLPGSRVARIAIVFSATALLLYVPYYWLIDDYGLPTQLARAATAVVLPVLVALLPVRWPSPVARASALSVSEKATVKADGRCCRTKEESNDGRRRPARVCSWQTDVWRSYRQTLPPSPFTQELHLVRIDTDTAPARVEIHQWQPTLWGGVALVRLRSVLGQRPRGQTLLEAGIPTLDAHRTALVRRRLQAGNRIADWQ